MGFWCNGCCGRDVNWGELNAQCIAKLGATSGRIAASSSRGEVSMTLVAYGAVKVQQGYEGDEDWRTFTMAATARSPPECGLGT